MEDETGVRRSAEEDSDAPSIGAEVYGIRV